MAAPTITTQAASGILLESATGNGNITVGTATKRGFQYNTLEYPDKEVSESGSFGTGAYTLSLTGLTPGQKYYYRAFAENVDGVGYGSWQSFTATAPTYNVTINSIDRTTDIKQGSLRINDVINDRVNTCRLILDNISGDGIPSADEEIVITSNDGTKLFAGYVVDISYRNKVRSGGEMVAILNCVDYTRLLDRNLVHETYEDMTDKAIIEAIVEEYCEGLGITTDNVVEGATIDQISFNYIQPSQAIRIICELTGRNWYIDYDKDIHYFPLATTASPFDIDSNTSTYRDLEIRKDASQIKNRVYVRGGTKLSEFTTYIEVGDGEKTKFPLPDKPHSVTVEVDTGGGYVEKTVGIKNVDIEGYDWYLNYMEKYLEQDSGGSVLTSSHKLKVTYKYDIPILVAVENKASILDHGSREFAIFDKSIATTQAARDRASGELTDYAENLIEGSFKTWETGFVSGQYININLSDYGVNDDYLVKRVIATSIGAGHYQYEIFVASAKTLGIIKFLIKLLEADKNLIELDDDEVVDELLELSDSLLSDSLLDSLTIDSAGPYRTWCEDSLETTETRARWNLFQWG